VTFRSRGELEAEYGESVVELGLMLAKGTNTLAALRTYAATLEPADQANLLLMVDHIGNLIFGLVSFGVEKLKLDQKNVVACATAIDESVDVLQATEQQFSELMQRLGGSGKPH